MFTVVPLIIELIQKMPIFLLSLRPESQYDRIFQTCYLSESKFALILLLCLVFVFPVFLFCLYRVLCDAMFNGMVLVSK